MKRFLCLSLCLGLMASACKKKYTQDDLDKARAEGKASGGSTAVAKKDKAAVIEACLPLINTHLTGVYTAPQDYFVLRQTTAYTTTAAAPALIVYSSDHMPFEFTATYGFAETAAEVTTNLAKMAKDKDIQAQFVDRDGDNKGKGYRVFISAKGLNNGTINQAIAAPAAGSAPGAPADGATYKIFDRENTKADGQAAAAIVAEATLNTANTNDPRAGWYDCVLNTTTQKVTLMYSDTAMV